MKQARAFGVGIVLATQNPMDLDYRTLSNAGLWCIGRLQTDAGRARVLEGLASAATANDGASMAELGEITKRLSQRWFLIRDVHSQRHQTAATTLGHVVPARPDDGHGDPQSA